MPLNAIGSIIGSGIEAASSMAGLKKQHEYNKEMAALQNQYNIDMWNRQNEYNSPVQQMNRLKEAGLNPNLMYGQGTVGNASSAPHLSAPNAPDVQGAVRDAAKAINPFQIMEMVIKLRKDLADAESAEQRANILGIQGLVAGSEVNALLDPLYEVDLDGNISFNRNLGSTVVRDPNNKYFNLGSGIGSEYFSLLNALKAQKEIIGSRAKVVSSSKTNIQSKMLERDLNWYNANQWTEIFGKFTPIVNTLLVNLLKR